MLSKQKAAEGRLRGRKMGTKSDDPDDVLEEFISRRKKHRRGSLRAIRLGEGLPSLPEMASELQDMMDVLIGRTPPPVDLGTINLMELADAYFARASEMTMMLQRCEREGTVLKGSAHYKYRVGELRTFMEVAKRSADLGSRRITQDQLEFEMTKYGRESKGLGNGFR